MRILLLSFYYQPDLSAGSFRATALVAALLARSGADVSIDIVTTSPNRYHSFSKAAAEHEVGERLEIRRVPLPTHRSEMLHQSRAFAHFARAALRHVAERDYDLVFATSSRLMTAALGAWIARRKQVPLYLDVRDIFVDTIKDVLPWPVAWPARVFFSTVEGWTMRWADRINLVSRGFEGYFRARYADRALSWFTNGIDDEFLPAAHAGPRARVADRPATVVYAGNIGAGQGLHEILPALAARLRDRARFVVIGDGGRRKALQAALARAGVDNVELRNPVPRSELLEIYRESAVLFLHLGEHAAFEKVLPSKLFEYAALGKPVLAGVAGYAARFVREEITNARVFPPCDVDAAVAAFGELEIIDRPRPDFVAKYARANIARDMADDMLEIARTRSKRCASS